MIPTHLDLFTNINAATHYITIYEMLLLNEATMSRNGVFKELNLVFRLTIAKVMPDILYLFLTKLINYLTIFLRKI